jgi:hypothetical protein
VKWSLNPRGHLVARRPHAPLKWFAPHFIPNSPQIHNDLFIHKHGSIWIAALTGQVKGGSGQLPADRPEGRAGQVNLQTVLGAAEAGGSPRPVSAPRAGAAGPRTLPSNATTRPLEGNMLFLNEGVDMKLNADIKFSSCN